jgi:hypothetical protein
MSRCLTEAFVAAVRDAKRVPRRLQVTADLVLSARDHVIFEGEVVDVADLAVEIGFVGANVSARPTYKALPVVEKARRRANKGRSWAEFEASLTAEQRALLEGAE